MTRQSTKMNFAIYGHLELRLVAMVNFGSRSLDARKMLYKLVAMKCWYFNKTLPRTLNKVLTVTDLKSKESVCVRYQIYSK
jgi:hypothetical protein